eukprot:COSAG01_NODE_7990_length_2962_cov_2.836186_1_plen_139_part_00
MHGTSGPYPDECLAYEHSQGCMAAAEAADGADGSNDEPDGPLLAAAVLPPPPMHPPPPPVPPHGDDDDDDAATAQTGWAWDYGRPGDDDDDDDDDDDNDDTAADLTPYVALTYPTSHVRSEPTLPTATASPSAPDTRR